MTTTAARRRVSGDAGPVAGPETLRLGGRVDDDGFMALMDGRDPCHRRAPQARRRAFEGGGVRPDILGAEVGERAVSDRGAEAGWCVGRGARVGGRRGAGLTWSARRAGCAAAAAVSSVRWGTGFVAAAYRHRMSRAEDPQLHTHAAAANMARGADGRWTALDATPIYQHAKAAGLRLPGAPAGPPSMSGRRG